LFSILKKIVWPSVVLHVEHIANNYMHDKRAMKIY